MYVSDNGEVLTVMVSFRTRSAPAATHSWHDFRATLNVHIPHARSKVPRVSCLYFFLEKIKPEHVYGVPDSPLLEMLGNRMSIISENSEDERCASHSIGTGIQVQNVTALVTRALKTKKSKK